MGAHKIVSPAVMNSKEYLAWRHFHNCKSKLSISVDLAVIMCEFVALILAELKIPPTYTGGSLILAVVVTSSCLVAASMFSVVMSRFILPHLESAAKMGMDQIEKSPHDKVVFLTTLCWVLTSSISIFLFTLDAILICWIKFGDHSHTAAVSATVIFGSVLICTPVCGVMCYRAILTHKFEVMNKKCDDLEDMQAKLNRDIAQAFNGISSMVQRISFSLGANNSTPSTCSDVGVSNI